MQFPIVNMQFCYVALAYLIPFCANSIFTNFTIVNMHFYWNSRMIDLRNECNGALKGHKNYGKWI